MSYGFLEIDHLLASGDPEIGGAAYERLGFTVTPISVIGDLGVANRLVLLRPLSPGTAAFFECMGVVDAEVAGTTPMAALLAGPPGVRSMVLSGPNAQQSFDALTRDGFRFQRLIDVERDWRLPDGEVLKPAFRVTLPIHAPLSFNFCEYRTLHYYLRDEWLEHENGARHLSRVFAISSDPGAVASYYARVFAKPPRCIERLYAVAPGRCELCVGDATALQSLLPVQWLPTDAGAERYLGFEVEVESLAAVGKLLRSRNIEFVEYGAAIVVAPHEACGNVLRIIGSSSRDCSTVRGTAPAASGA